MSKSVRYLKADAVPLHFAAWGCFLSRSSYVISKCGGLFTVLGVISWFRSLSPLLHSGLVRLRTFLIGGYCGGVSFWSLSSGFGTAVSIWLVRALQRLLPSQDLGWPSIFVPACCRRPCAFPRKPTPWSRTSSIGHTCFCRICAVSEARASWPSLPLSFRRSLSMAAAEAP